MIYLKAYVVLFSQKGKIRLKHIDLKRKYFWPNELIEEWNIFKPENWRKYLIEIYRRPNGHKLPLTTYDGDPIFYEVYMFGTSRLAQEHFNMKTGPGGPGGKIYLFPGYDKNMVRKKLKNTVG